MAGQGLPTVRAPVGNRSEGHKPRVVKSLDQRSLESNPGLTGSSTGSLPLITGSLLPDAPRLTMVCTRTVQSCTQKRFSCLQLCCLWHRGRCWGLCHPLSFCRPQPQSTLQPLLSPPAVEQKLWPIQQPQHTTTAAVGPSAC